MRKRIQWATSLLAALAATVTAGASTARADTILWMGGTGGTLGRQVPPDWFGSPADLLGGAFASYKFKPVQYPSSLWPVTGLADPRLGRSIAEGVADLVAAVHDTVGPVIVAGVSQGAMVVQRAQALLNLDPSIPSNTKFIMIGDPDLGLLKRLQWRPIPILNYVPRPLPQTRFDTVVVTNQYDGFAQPISKFKNRLTDINALLGTAFVHSTAHTTDLSRVPKSNITVSVNPLGGTTTKYFVPTDKLPLTMPLRALGVPDRTVDAIDAALRPIIDAGYRTPPGRNPFTAGSTATTGAGRPNAAAANTRPAGAERRRGTGKT